MKPGKALAKARRRQERKEWREVSKLRVAIIFIFKKKHEGCAANEVGEAY